ncbi:MAG: hypothetical protein Q9M23_03260, partial [Mariprofundaceae bacterium]|nr:hypothetical protein [Mariprofundaceae bacterium]
CTVMDDPVDEDLLLRLQGNWQQQDGNASISFYDDATVKLSMPDEKPPLRLLTSVENNKDHGIGFSVGDRWGGPVYILADADGNSLQLKFPPSDPRLDDGRVMRFNRNR